MKKREYWKLMGSIVTVSEIYERRTNGEERKWERKPTPERAGWVVGFRTVQNGTIDLGRYNPSTENYEPAYLAIESVVQTMLVSFTPHQKPRHVPLDGYVLGGVPEHRENPWDERSKEWMREAAKSFPRDKQGRFA